MMLKSASVKQIYHGYYIKNKMIKKKIHMGKCANDTQLTQVYVHCHVYYLLGWNPNSTNKMRLILNMESKFANICQFGTNL